MWEGHSQLESVEGPVNGVVTLVYRHTDPDTGRTQTERVETRHAQTDAWIHNWGAGRAQELDALDAFASRAQGAKGVVVVTDHIASVPPRSAEQLAAEQWVQKINEADRIQKAVSWGFATKADADRLAVLRTEIVAEARPNYKDFLR